MRRFLGCSILFLGGFLLAGGSASARELTFDDRVKAQEAIERVYYAHQIGATKPFEEAVPHEVLEKKVRAYLKQSVVLEEYWKTPITAQALEREIERMASNTRLPERLREIYSALGDDRQLILECLARPALADRLARNFFAFDQRIHGTERQKAEELRERLLTGKISPQEDHPLRKVFEFMRIEPEERSPDGGVRAAGGADLTTPARIDLEVTEYSHTRASVPADIDSIGALIEERAAFLIHVVLAESASSFSLATYTIPKTGWDEWWSRSTPVLGGAAADSGNLPMLRLRRSTLPETSAGVVTGSVVSAMELPSCLPGDTWNNGLLDPLPGARSNHTAVWTGTEMILWGGTRGSVPLNSGGRYDPATDTWSPMANAPLSRVGHTAVWTGTEMIVWGGRGDGGDPTSGGRYDPATDTWRLTSAYGAPELRLSHSAVWTGTEMIVWGGEGLTFFNSGGRYNPATDTWDPTSTTDAPEGRILHAAVWTGTEMIVWGGLGSGFPFSGGRYNPLTDTWIPTSTDNAPEGSYSPTAVWTGREMIVWGGLSGDNHGFVNTGGRYDPAADTWTPISTDDAPESRMGHTAVWTGREMIVWGGIYPSGRLDSGGLYNPTMDTWSQTSMVNAPAARASHTAVWTGTQMIVWGGDDGDYGGRYDPTMDTWTPAPGANAPAGRVYHTAVWTGTEMIVWGGLGGVGNISLNSGGRYDPAIDNWVPTSTLNAPAARLLHTAVWTGTEMIVWAGYAGGYVKSGGRYDPIGDTWAPTSTIGVPAARGFHTAVWTGTEMIVWGGTVPGTRMFDSGGRYNPSTDTWATSTTTDTPVARYSHSAIWTGTEMIVWGGVGEDSSGINTGGRYDPATDTWVPTSTDSVPEGRSVHTAVWTGTEMIVWGGTNEYGALMSSGGRYDPTTDTWVQVSTANAPEARTDHTAVWTGARMIVWGGIGGPSGYTNSGGRYDPATDSWAPTSFISAPAERWFHTAVWAGTEMIVWGGSGSGYLNSGGRYSPNASFDPPVVSAGPDRAVECASIDGTVVELHAAGTGCGSLAFTWTGPFAEGRGSIQGSKATVTLPLGASPIMLRAVDSQGQSSTDTVTVSVVDTVAPTLVCPSSSLAECTAAGGTEVTVPPPTVTDACDPRPLVSNSHTGAGADASGLYPLGETAVTVASEDQSGNRSTCAALVTVKDTTPPTLTALAEPPSLWPPNHDLVPVKVFWQARDVCDPSPAVALVSVTNSEPDDAPGTGDGSTTGDIAGVEVGTADAALDLRAEREGSGPGRTYQLTYAAIDSSGNATPAFAVVTVPHDQGSGPEPLLMRLEPDVIQGMVRIYWTGIPGALGYDVISGDLSQVTVENRRLSLGAVRVLARGTTQTSLTEGAVGEIPAPGKATFYLIQSRTDRGGGGYGTESSPWPRVPASCDGGCP
jgi:N-acetylneuraminic acid mutarotase